MRSIRSSGHLDKVGEADALASEEGMTGLGGAPMSRRLFASRMAVAVPTIMAGGAAAQLLGERGAAASTPGWRLEGNEDTSEQHFLGTKHAQPLRFGTSDVERVRIDSDGRLGVGTSRPEARLHVTADGERAILASARGAVGFETEGSEKLGGKMRGTALGLHGLGGDFGVYGEVQRGGFSGLYGHSAGARGRAIGGGSSKPGSFGLQVGVGGSDSFGVFSETGAPRSPAVYGLTHARHSTGLYGAALGHDSTGIFADGSVAFKTTYALWAEGRSHVNGSLTHSVSGFKIDHPLRPSSHFLTHSSVESSEMKNVYDGVATLDAVGRATVTLPRWFESLNRDFRYQLTAIGRAAPALHVASEVSRNRFEIAGGQAGMRVSWMITGVRHDAWAKANPMRVVEEKPAHKTGSYLHPELHSSSRAIQPRPLAPEIL